MLASRSMKPTLSLNINASAQKIRPNLSLKSPLTLTPLAPLASPTPLTPLPLTPTSRNTKLNQRGMTTMIQQPTYSYANNSTSRSILKRTSQAGVSRARQLSFEETPVVYCVSPIEDEGYYGGYKKMSREERRWMVRN